MSEPANLYHYTSGTGLLGIVDSDSVWATQIHYLNDSKEFQHAIDLAKEVLDATPMDSEPTDRLAIKQNLSLALDNLSGLGIYVACFSEAPDSLSQWRGYCAPGFGYCLGFVKSELQACALGQGFNLGQCIYDERQQRESIKIWVNFAIRAITAQRDHNEDAREFTYRYMSAFARIAPLFKHHSFKDEREWRLTSLIAASDQRIKLRPMRSMLAPYVSIKLNLREGGNLFSDLTVGPTPHKELARNAVEHLKGRGPFQNGIRSSEVPYRDW